MDRRLVSALILIVAAIISISLYITLMPRQTQAARVVVYAYNDRVTGIDPSIEDDTGLVVLGLVYEPLLYYNPVKNEFKPALAVNWSSNEDGTEWVFHLRRGVKFHDGTPFNATAVKISVERARDIYRETGRGLGYIWDAVEEVQVVDEYTVRFKLSYPQRLDIIAAASYAAYIFSPSALVKSGASSPMDRALEEWFNTGNEAGTGPYMITYYRPDSEIRLRKFNEWWGWSIVNNPDAPDEVVIRIVTEPQSQYNGLIAGEIDVASSVPRDNIADLVKKGFKVFNLTTFHNYIMFFNVKRYPTNITEFRKAILHMINLDEAVALAMKGYAVKGSGVVPHGFPGHVDGLSYRYDKEEALKYLNESGVRTPVSIEILYQVDYEELKIFAEYLQSRLREIGVNLILKPQPWSQLKDTAKGVWENPESTPHIIIADWWPTIPSPYDYLYSMFHSDSKEWNFAGFEDPEFDELIDSAFEVEGSNYTHALLLYKDAQEKLFNEAIAVNLWDEIKPFIYSGRIEIPEEAMNPLYMYVISFQYVKVKT
ncbi:ABC transporter substrate-binding protein [Desulfurococcus mucosus]|uniref:Extracellular solute-binding protein family 5 n=1 Tax=Desulfurococcus mucosus (strain ATCC 35584 / DSM 2162 / JCM 9187 / O7/1) TaxID=765177 RepID=E8R9T6_DESM0|nr:ABC transporter substrate-binding protein [Desulfurococcus mucosus]ADV65262.1 extracellular solute-binding protein family 5 [Desulfurococcus mucosus DSM 2162]